MLDIGLPAARNLTRIPAKSPLLIAYAVLCYAVPEANPPLYFGLSLGIAVPLNMLFGIPLCLYIAGGVLG